MSQPSPSQRSSGHSTRCSGTLPHCASRFSFYVGGAGRGQDDGGRDAGPPARGRASRLPRPDRRANLSDAARRHRSARSSRCCRRSLIAPTHKTEGHLILRNGSEILFRSLDAPDRLRGLNLAWFWLDEAPLCGYYAWQVLKGRLRQRGYATAGWATGTPKGRDGFARDFELAPRPGHALFRASTWANAAQSAARLHRRTRL